MTICIQNCIHLKDRAKELREKIGGFNVATGEIVWIPLSEDQEQGMWII
jgi:hypothetical protein